MHAAFKGLWNELTKNLTHDQIDGKAVRAAVAAKPTITWPSDRQFQEAIGTTRLYVRKVKFYALKEFELSLRSEAPSDLFHIEHIAPQTPTDHWKAVMGEEYPELVDTWGNLVALSSVMNSGVSQKPFADKRESFQSSRFGGARELSEDHLEWTPTTIKARNERIAAWAVRRWPY